MHRAGATISAPRARFQGEINMGSIMDKLKGKAKDIEGRVTGDKVRSAQGKAGMAKGEAKGVAERASAKVKAGVSRAKSKLQRGRAKANARTSRAR
jgi:uncharacterized protein YjbJ (UPF0337 family)